MKGGTSGDDPRAHETIGASATAVVTDEPSATGLWESRPAPTLPPSAPKDPAPTNNPEPSRPAATSTWYRSDHERYRSVHRRANPWWRKLARGIVALCLIAALGAGLYFGAQQLDKWLDRNRLPAPGVDQPDFRQTTIQIQSTSPAVTIDGTLTLDRESGAYQFTGREAGPQGGLDVVTLDGTNIFVRENGGGWRSTGADEPVVSEISTAIDYLVDVDTSDAILPKPLRQNYVELVNRATEGLGDDELTRFEMVFDTSGFSDNFPFQWGSFQDEAIPGVAETDALSVTIWVDRDDVLVRVLDDDTGWSWQRTSYSDDPFVPENPLG